MRKIFQLFQKKAKKKKKGERQMVKINEKFKIIRILNNENTRY